MHLEDIAEILMRVADDYAYGDYRRHAVEEAYRIINELKRTEDMKNHEQIKNRVV